jgi:Cu(I)/Ag(I) efflux system membrane fusion protein
MTKSTRYALILALALSAASGTAVAQTTHSATGVVKKIDAAKGTVTLAHDPVKSLKWPAMTMDFRVRDKASLATLKPDQKIEFELIEEKKGSYVISRIK